MNRTTSFQLSVLLLLVFFATRIAAIDLFPVFIDETLHIHYGEKMLETGSPVYDDIGRLFTIWWVIPFQAFANEPVWIARVAIVLVTLPGTAALLALGHAAQPKWGALLAGLLVITSTYLLFFGRLALADPAANSMIALALLFASRLKNRLRPSDAILTGALLFVAYGFKAASLYYLVIPAAAALTLKPHGRPWRAQVVWLIYAVATFGLLFGAFNGVLLLRGHSTLLNHIRYALTGSVGDTATGSTLLTLPARILENAALSLQLQSHYTGPVIAILLVVAVGYFTITRRFFLPLILFLPLVAIWAQESQNSRYFVTPITILMLIGAIALASLLAVLPRRGQPIALVIIALGLLVHWGPFYWASTHDPLAIPLADRDAAEHVRSDASGFGLAEARWALLAHGATRVIGIMANCQGLRYLSLDDFPVECPRVNPNGEDIPALQALMESSRAPGVFVVLEDLPYAPDHTPGVISATIRHASGRPRLTIYALDPDYRPCNYCG